MPDAWPDYPHHCQLLSYFERYADHFDLREHIWFGTEVIRVEPVDDAARRAGTSPPAARAVGAPRTSATPPWWSPTGTTGRRSCPATRGWRSSAARSCTPAVQGPGPAAGQAGPGGRGRQHRLRHRGRGRPAGGPCWHSTRRGYWYAPKYVLGRPADQVNDRILALRLPLRLRQWLLHRTLRLTVGDLTRFGLPKPDHRVYETHPIVNSQLVYYVGHGEITPVPDVERFDRYEVELTDGRTIEPDLVIFATGYLPRFEFLDPELLSVDSSGRPRLALQTLSRGHPTLAVAGLVQPDSAIFTLVHWQTVLIARWLRLLDAGPDRGPRCGAKFQARPDRRFTEAKVKDTTRHWFEVGHFEYLRALEKTLDELEAAA